ncbi:malate dehydrogenase [bacterium]|nr:malate dehydrogenase [bacterium]
MSQPLNITDQEILRYHLGGKIGLDLTKKLADKRSLSIAYTPGVARPCLIIKNDPDSVYKYTSRGNLVAVVTDGSAVLGLGDIGPKASIPVMEGKAVLFKSFAGIDAWPVPLENCRKYGNEGSTDIGKLVDVAASLAGMYGGINLEDIAAPACFEVEERLQRIVDCPVFHDDQWGTAIITLAALKNYALLTGKNMEELNIVINGAGAAGIRIAETLRSEGAGTLLLLDSHGVINKRRHDLNLYKKAFAVNTTKTDLADALKGADVFIGVSCPGLVTKDMVNSMAECPAIFAMANPEPEITPQEASKAMGKRPYIMATGRSDYPNQINNALGFPYIFRGALDTKARRISMSMKKAASEALARLAQMEAPDYLKDAYPGEKLSFGFDYIIPKPFDRRLLVEVSYAVADAACQEGAGSVTDLSNYRLYLEALAYTSEEDISFPFIIERFCQFGDQHTICVGRKPDGTKESFLCDPQFMDSFINDESIPGRQINLYLKKGKLVKVSA